MEFIAHVDCKTVFGNFGTQEQHAFACSREAAECFFRNGLKIFRSEASTLNALKLIFSEKTICIYRELDDMENGTFRVRTFDAVNSWTEKAMSCAAMKKACLAEIRAEFNETEAA